MQNCLLMVNPALLEIVHSNVFEDYQDESPFSRDDENAQEAAKNARASLSFESPPPAKSRKLKSPFTPVRTAADIIGATQADEDFERNFLASQSSRTTARIRLEEKYVKDATLYKDKCTPEEIKERIREIAFNSMVKSAIYEDLDPADRPYGGFKKIMCGQPTFLFLL
jgi:hypothetical protein